MMPNHSQLRFDRRSFLKTSAAVSGGLVVNFVLPLALRPALAQPATAAGFAPNAFIRIDRQGGVALVMPMVEMGQGIYTAMAMLLAEELEVGLDQVRLEHAPPNDVLYANSILHIQTTGLSSSIRAFWVPLRQAGAVARTLLIASAAMRWGVDTNGCRAEHGEVLHTASGRRLSYGDLVAAAAALPVPAPDGVALKTPKEFTLIGTPAKRVEAPEKVNGRTEFGIDVRLPGMRFAAIAISPVLGGKPKSVNDAAARAVKGVLQVVRVDEAVAVVADHMWADLGPLRSSGTTVRARASTVQASFGSLSRRRGNQGR
jgi:isoquinoline 1-oxidoreductase subunit beta